MIAKRTVPAVFEPLYKLKVPPVDAFYEHCSAGHDQHVRTLVQKQIGDIKPIYQIYDWREYFQTVDGNETFPEHDGYCTGQDIISYCIDRQDVWEPQETALILSILNQPHAPSDVVLDFGSHIGYYSILAALHGFHVASMDGSRENLELLQESARLNEVEHLIDHHLCWLDKDTPILPADKEDVHFLKVDVEGAEQFALQATIDLFNYRKVKYAIFEISPTFNGSYPDLVETIAKLGYDVYQIPDAPKAKELEGYDTSPLILTMQNCAVPAEGRREYVAGLHQENFLFVRRDV